MLWRSDENLHYLCCFPFFFVVKTDESQIYWRKLKKRKNILTSFRNYLALRVYAILFFLFFLFVCLRTNQHKYIHENISKWLNHDFNTKCYIWMHNIWLTHRKKRFCLIFIWLSIFFFASFFHILLVIANVMYMCTCTFAQRLSIIRDNTVVCCVLLLQQGNKNEIKINL